MMRFLILGLLRTGRSAHGYALMKEYRQETGRALSIGNFYRELQRLRAEGFIRSTENVPGSDPRRIPYAIADAGARAFDAWLRGPGGDGIDGPEDEYSLRAFFALRAELDTARRVLAVWRDDLQNRYRLIARARDEAELKIECREVVTHLPLWLARRLNHVMTDLDFVDRLASTLESSEAAKPEPRKTSRIRRPRRATTQEPHTIVAR